MNEKHLGDQAIWRCQIRATACFLARCKNTLKWHVTSSQGQGLEHGQNKLTTFTVSFILEKEINEGNFNINEVARI